MAHSEPFSWLEWGSFMPFAAGHVKIPPFATKTKATRNLVVTCNRIVVIIAVPDIYPPGIVSGLPVSRSWTVSLAKMTT